MPHDPQNLTRGTVPLQATLAPLAAPTCKIDFTDDAPTEKTGIVRLYNLADEFMAWRAGKIIVAAKEFQVGVTDAAVQQSYHGIAFRTPWLCSLSNRCTSLFKVDRNHAG